MRFSTNGILRISVAIVILTVATVLFISIRQSQRAKDTTAAVINTEQVIYHLQNLALAVTDNESNARAYVITGHEKFLQPLRNSETQIHTELNQLKTLLEDTAAKQLLYDSLSPYIYKRIAYSADMIFRMQSDGPEAARNMVAGKTGNFYSGEIRRITKKLQEIESRFLQQRKAKNEKSISQLSTTLYWVLGIVCLLSLRIIFKVRSDVRYILLRRKKEEELRKSEERFRLLINNVKDYAIFMLDVNGCVITWNSGAERIKGYTADEIMGRPIDVFYVPEDVKNNEPASNLQMARQEGRYEKEGWRLRKDGTVFWANTVITAMFNDTGILQGYAKITRDISDRKKNEEQLRFLSFQLNQSNDAIYVVDASSIIVSWNKGAEKLFGFSQEEALGQQPNSLLKTIITPEQVKDAMHQLEKNDHWSGELKRKTKSGREIFLYASNSTIRDENNNITGYVAVNLDITERKFLEDKLKKFNEELEGQVRIKTAELTGIFERITDSFIALDKDFQYLYVNKKAGEMFQRNPESLVGKKMAEEYPFIVHTDLYKGFNEAMASQQPVVISEYYAPMGLFLENYIYPSPEGLSLFIRDITGQKRTEEQLRTAHDRLLFHVENAPLGFVEWDNQLQVKSWSRHAEEIFGWTEKEMVEQQISHVNPFPGNEIPPLSDIARKMIEAKEERSIVQCRNYTNDGRIIWCEWFNSAIKNEKGEVVTVLSLVQDITDRRKAEKELMSSYAEKQVLAERLSIILDTLPANIALLDQKGIIIDVNEAWKRFGQTNGLVSSNFGIGTDYLAIALGSGKSEERDGKDAGQGILSVLSGRLDEFSMDYPCHSPELKRWFRMIATPLKGKSNAGAVVMHIDITEQKLSEDRIRLSEQKYKFLFDSNPMPMWMRSMDDGRIIDVNKAACEAYGYTKEEFLEMNPTDMRHPDEIENFLKEFQLDVPGPTNRGIWKHKRKDNIFVDVEIFVQDIVYNKRKARLILAKDVTEKVKAEERLRQSYQEIRRLVSHLQNIREEERIKMAREIHDQLGQQLTVMKMDISWLYKKMSEAEKPIRDRMQELRDVMDDTVKLVRRISADLRPSLLDDMGLLAAIEWHLSEMSKRSGITIEMTGLTVEPVLSRESKTNLFRILQESLTNVSRHAKATRVIVSLSMQDNELVMTISDNGIGFDGEKAAQKETLGILGMRERTAMMGGTYEINSTPGQGTTVLVSIPMITS